MKVDNFEDKLFKGFVIPGIGVGIVLLLLFVQPWISTNILTRPWGGPAGMALGFAMFPLAMMFVTYMMVSIVYAFILLIKYFRRSDGYIKSACRFMLFSNVFLLVMDLSLLIAFIEAARWNFFSSLNLPLVITLTALAIIMTVFFLYWIIAIYRHEGRKLLTWKTFGVAILNMVLLQLPTIATCLYMMFI